MYNRPKISIIVPVYNVAPWLPACLESVCQQTFKDFEVLVINDGSTDDSAEVIARFKNAHPHFMCIDQANAGLTAAQRVGLLRAEGEAICFVDGDDFIEPMFLQQLWAVYTATRAPLVIGCTARYYAQDGHQVPDDAPFYNGPVLEGMAKAAVFGCFSSAMSLCGKLFARELLERVEIPDQASSGDIYPSIQANFLAHRIAPAPGAVYFYRQGRPGSLTQQTDKKWPGLWQGFLNADLFLYAHQASEVFYSAFERLRWTCLLSHISAHGLSASEWQTVQKNRQDVLHTPARYLRPCPWRTRAQFITLQAALRYGFSYPALLKHAQKYAYRPLKNLLMRAARLGRRQK